jgi:hypothetical protein
MANNQYRTRGAAQDFFRNAANGDMCQTASPMRPHDDQIDLVLLGIAADLAVRCARNDGLLDAELHHDMWLELLLESLLGVTQAISFRLSSAHEPRLSNNVEQVQAGVESRGQITRSANCGIAEPAEVARH